jgi:nucleoid-associated protein YgaU
VCVAASALAGASFGLTGSGQAAAPAAAANTVQATAVPTTALPATPTATPTTAPTVAPTAAPTAASTAAPKAGRAAAAKPAGCLTSGDGYLRAHLAGAIEANVDWPNSGTRCEGESRDRPPGVRLSFRRAHGDKTDLLFVFGITGVRQGKPAHEAGTNLTVIVQGANRIFSTMGDSRCTVDSLTQQPLDEPGAYRVEARGFCTQPAHAVLGAGAVLVSTFEFAGPVNYDAHND